MAALLQPVSSQGAVEIGVCFSNGMVLQREARIPVWGKAGAGEAITVTFAGQEKKVIATGDGRWQATLDPLKACNAGSSLKVTGVNTVTITDVLVGDVWLLTGCPDLLAAPKELVPAADAAGLDIRVLALPCRTAKTPLEEIPAAHWLAFPKDAAGSSAFFGLQFAKAYRERCKNVPVGIILAASETPNSGGLIFSGDILEAWAPAEVLSGLPWNDQLVSFLSDERMLGNAKVAFEQKLAAWKAKNGTIETPKDEKEYDVWFYEKLASVQKGDAPPAKPSLERIQGPSRVWNGMIAPLTRTPLRGVIYVPGIGNLGNPNAVSRILPAMVEGWRSKWGNKQLPFICLGPWPAGYGDETYVAGAELADAYRTVGTLPSAALIPFADLYDPAKKSTIPDTARLAQRVAPCAADLGEGKSATVAPVLVSAVPEGGAMVLKAADPRTLPAEGTIVDGFTLYSPKTHWVWAKGTVRKGTVVVSHPQVPAPTAVRYGWMKDSEHPANLVGPDGIPAPVYRSDTRFHIQNMIPLGNIQMALKRPKEGAVEAIDIYPVEDPTLPWVMTIGDSIHNGYRFEVRKLLAGVANVIPLTTPASSRGALGSDRPLWGIERDELAVLHINHGLHWDYSEPPEEYEALLDKYFGALRETVGKGKVIWAATTPIPSKNPGESLDPTNNASIIRINEVARKLAAKHGVEFNDLYSQVAPNVDSLSIAKGNVHFNSSGCKILAEAVAQAIRKNLPEPK
jgi:sialate O-acetylesterase